MPPPGRPKARHPAVRAPADRRAGAGRLPAAPAPPPRPGLSQRRSRLRPPGQARTRPGPDRRPRPPPPAAARASRAGFRAAPHRPGPGDRPVAGTAAPAPGEPKAPSSGPRPARSACRPRPSRRSGAARRAWQAPRVAPSPALISQAEGVPPPPPPPAGPRPHRAPRAGRAAPARYRPEPGILPWESGSRRHPRAARAAARGSALPKALRSVRGQHFRWKDWHGVSASSTL